MIPAQFEYHQPGDIPAAVSLLSELGDDARIIAGGHSLIPMMKLRLAQPEHLIDLRAIDDLNYIRVTDSLITIGAMTTQHELIQNNDLASAAPIIKEAALQIADPQIRYVGTVGGNVANGDPGNDMPGLMQCLDASFSLVGPNGTREVAARDFYEAAYFTAREDSEILTAISFKPTTGGYAYQKQKRKIGDYATAASAVLLQKDAAGLCTSASIAMTNLADTPIWCQEASDGLVGSAFSDPVIESAVQSCISSIEPVDDNRGPIEFKKHAAAMVLRRAIEQAWARA